MMMGFGWIGLILLLAFWVMIIAVALWLMKSLFPDSSQAKDHQDMDHLSAREVLDHRYARGELSRDRYLAMIEDLKQSGEG